MFIYLIGGENDDVYNRTFHVYLHTHRSRSYTCI